jgi:hypothetical protein
MKGLGRGAPVSEREQQCQEAPASICKPLVASGQEEDLMLREGSTEQRQHIGDTYRNRRGLVRVPPWAHSENPHTDHQPQDRKLKGE